MGNDKKNKISSKELEEELNKIKRKNFKPAYSVEDILSMKTYLKRDILILNYLYFKDLKSLDSYSKDINNALELSFNSIKKTINKLLENSLIEKIKTCPSCNKKYRQVPSECLNCGSVIGRVEPDNGLNQNPFFYVRLTERGRRFVRDHLQTANEYYAIFRIENVRRKLKKQD